jgi:hypothetical protein
MQLKNYRLEALGVSAGGFGLQPPARGVAASGSGQKPEAGINASHRRRPVVLQFVFAFNVDR